MEKYAKLVAELSAIKIKLLCDIITKDLERNNKIINAREYLANCIFYTANIV